MAQHNQYTPKSQQLKNATTKGKQQQSATADQHQANHGQGAVKHPETDGRLKDNR